MIVFAVNRPAHQSYILLLFVKDRL